MRPITRADNGQLLTIDAEDGYIFIAEDLDDGNSIRVENTSGTHYDNPFVFTNFYQTRVNYGAGVKKRTISGPFPMPDGATYRFDITEQSQGNKALLVTVEASGGGTGGADTTARALAKAATDRLDQIYPGSGKNVTPGSTVSILTTDVGIVEVTNPTANPITVPANPAKADLLAKGLTEKISGGTSDTVTLASLSADTWTAVPISTRVPAPTRITVFDASGRDITDSINIRKVSGTFELGSSVTMSNLTIILEG